MRDHEVSQHTNTSYPGPDKDTLAASQHIYYQQHGPLLTGAVKWVCYANDAY